MTKKKITRTSNRPIIIGSKRSNKYSWGGDFKNSLGGTTSLKDTFSGSSIGSMLKGGGLQTLGSAVGKVGGKLIGGNLESGAGKAISGVGSAVGGLVGKANPLLGTAITTASGIVGGLTNRVIGSKLNDEKIAEVENSNKEINNVRVDSSSTDSIANQWTNQDFGTDFSKSDIGEEGLFSNKASNKYKELKLQQDIARNRALTAFEGAAQVTDTATDLNALSNFAAFGGQLDTVGGVLDYDLSSQALGIQNMETLSRNKITSMPNSFGRGNKELAFGGTLSTNGADFSNGLTIINNGGTHEENPMEGVPMGVDSEGIPNLVEESEAIYNDYVFSNRLTANKKLLESVGLSKLYDNHSFADIAEKLGKESEERPNDPISKRGLNNSLERLKQAQEVLKQQKTAEKQSQTQNQNAEGNKFALGGTKASYTLLDPNSTMVGDGYEASKYIDNGVAPMSSNYDLTSYYYPSNPGGTSPIKARAAAKREGYNVGITLNDYYNNPLENSEYNKDNSTNKSNNETWLRYAPVVGASIGLGQNLFSKPNYSSANTILAAANTVGNYMPVGYNPIGNYLQYKPLDRNYYINNLNAQAGATRRAIMNSSSPSRNAALLAANYTTTNNLGNLARQAEEYNLAQRQAVETFNRGTNQANAELGLKAAMANQSALASARQAKLSGIVQAMKMRDDIDSRRNASLSANLTNLFDSLGNIGKEAYARNMIMSNPALYYSIDKDGKISYKNNFDDLSEAEKEQVKRAAARAKAKSTRGKSDSKGYYSSLV